jgi:hypothetical protein
MTEPRISVLPLPLNATLTFLPAMSTMPSRRTLPAWKQRQVQVLAHQP